MACNSRTLHGADSWSGSQTPAPQASTKAPLTIFGQTLRMDGEGRLSLTDMWKAGGGEERQKPRRWLEAANVQEFTDALARREGVRISSLIEVKRGAGAGTFAHWQLALAFAKWLSPELHMEVSKTYMRYSLRNFFASRFRYVFAQGP
jgi:hypothetical protein